MKTRTRQCRLVYTDERFIFAKRSYPRIPLLVDQNGVFVEPVCDYLRARVVYGHLSTSSARTYAENICQFWNHLIAAGLKYDEVTDDVLISWQNTQVGAEESTKAARCDSVFELYVWLEIEGYVRHSVRIPGFNDHEAFRPRLASKPTKTISGRRSSSGHGVVSAVRPRQHAKPNLPTPDTEEIGRLHAAVDRAANADSIERNHLLLDWYLQTGVRRLEWQSLTLAQIPSWEAINAAMLSMQPVEVLLITTKGGRSRHAGVLPELLERTREYIEGPRQRVVDRFRAKYLSSYKEPAEVFLSSKTGEPMDVRSISNLLTRLFEEAGVDGHGHRLRSTYLTRLFEAELMMEEARIAAHPHEMVQIDFELVLRRVAERAGHRHIDSLRPYLTIARKSRARSPKAETVVSLQQMLNAKRDELAHTEALIAARREQH